MPVAGLRRRDEASGAMMLPIPRSGVYRGVAGTAAAERVEGITGLEISVHSGEMIRTLPEGNRYLGFLFARGSTPASVEQSLREAHARLEFDID